MRTVTFKTILHGVTRMMGYDPDVDLTTELAAAYTEFINNRFREGYEWAFWPEVMLIEQRAYRQTHDSTEEYDEDDEVYSDDEDGYYIAAQDVPAGTAITNTTYWTELTSFNRYVPWDPPAGTTGLTEIGEVEQISRSDPRLTKYVTLLPFSPSADGIQVESDAPSLVYVKFRRRPGRFTSLTYNALTTYAADALVYYPPTGECYRALNSTTGNLPTTANWERVEFPAFLELFVKLAAYADALKDDGQLEKAEAVTGETDNPRPGTAYFELQRLQDVIFGQQGQGQAAQFIGR